VIPFISAGPPVASKILGEKRESELFPPASEISISLIFRGHFSFALNPEHYYFQISACKINFFSPLISGMSSAASLL